MAQYRTQPPDIQTPVSFTIGTAQLLSTDDPKKINELLGAWSSLVKQNIDGQVALLDAVAQVGGGQ